MITLPSGNQTSTSQIPRRRHKLWQQLSWLMSAGNISVKCSSLGPPLPATSGMHHLRADAIAMRALRVLARKGPRKRPTGLQRKQCQNSLASGLEHSNKQGDQKRVSGLYAGLFLMKKCSKQTKQWTDFVHLNCKHFSLKSGVPSSFKSVKT